MAPIVKELEKHLKYCNFLAMFENIGSQTPKTQYRRTPQRLKEEHISSAHYNSLTTKQRPRQTPCIIPQNSNRMLILKIPLQILFSVRNM